MFLITLNKVISKEVLKKVYTSIYEYNLKPIIFIEYLIDLKNKNYSQENIISDFFTLDLLELENMFNNEEISIDEIEDSLFDLIDMDKEIVLKNSLHSKILIDVVKNTGISYVIPEDILNIKDFDKLDTNAQLIIYDFFDKKHNYKKFKTNEFKYRFLIDNSGDIYFENKKVLNLLDKEANLLEILFDFKLIDIKSDKEKNHSKVENLLGTYIYDPHLYLIEDIDYDKEIINIKLEIFEKIKNVSPDEYKKMTENILELFNKNNYIQLNDILNIINGYDKTLKLIL